MPNVTSTAGDCFARIAKAQGFFNYRTVYNHDDNAANFPNPNQIAEGSTVKVPEKQMKSFDLPVDAEKRFKVVRKKTNLRLKLCKADVAQVPGILKATLIVGAKKATATSGTLDLDDIDPALTAGTLAITLANPAPFAGPPATAAPTANQHPPAIVAADFDDPATVWPKHGESFTWQLQLGYLEPQTVTRGVLQRLVNLGANCPVAQAEDDETRRAVRCYRRFAEAKAPPADTDASADIAGHIKTRHDG